jgi:acyl-CoA synthetase (NDP forming)
MTETSVLKEIERLIGAALDEGREILGEHEVYRILDLLGFTPPPHLFIAAGDPGSLDLSAVTGDRVVCKLISPQLPHRTEYGGIRFVDRREAAAVFADFAAIAARMGIEFSGMLVVSMIEAETAPPRQLLLSLRQDRSFGPVVAMGLGGTGTELWQKALRREKGLLLRAASACADAEDLEEALSTTFFYPVLAGRTRVAAEPLADPSLVTGALQAFAGLAGAFSPLTRDTSVTIEELEVNPLQISSDGRLVPLDALMRVSRIKGTRLPTAPEKIGRLLRPGRILIIGASAEKMNMGRVILRNVLAAGEISTDRIWLLHPSAAEIEGCRAFPSPADLPGPVDMVVFTIPASEQATDLIEDLIMNERASSIILISGGFGETEEGKSLDRKLRAAIAAGRSLPGGGTVLNGPNCMGIVSKPGGYNTFFLPEYKFPLGGGFGGRSAVISQSGAWLVTLLNTQAAFLDPKYMITVGNQIDLTVTDHLEHLAGDPDVDIFCLYIEGFRDWEGERFLGLAREITRSGRTIILYKAGRTAEGAAAVASHTAAMAGDYDVLERLLRDARVWVADTLEEMEDAIKVLVLLGDREVQGNRVAISSDAGYECSVAADRLGPMVLARFAEGTIEKLRADLPGIVDVHNPVDATPAITTERYGRCVAAILEDPGVDCALVSNVASTPFQENLPPGPGHHEDIAREGSHPNTIIRLFRATGKPMVVCMNEGAFYDPCVEMMERAGVPVFRKIDRAIGALGTFVLLRGRRLGKCD